MRSEMLACASAWFNDSPSWSSIRAQWPDPSPP